MSTTLALPGQDDRMSRVRAADAFILPVGTDWVRRDTLRVTEEITRIWPNLRVVQCHCGRCLAEGHYPFLVVEHGRDQRTHPVMGAVELNGKLLKRLWEAHRAQNPFDEMVAKNAAIMRDRKRRADEKRAEQLNVVRGALASHKHYYTAKSMGMVTSG